eukprot:1158376-Pelagomonas_calceolata.AAC.6
MPWDDAWMQKCSSSLRCMMSTSLCGSMLQGKSPLIGSSTEGVPPKHERLTNSCSPGSLNTHVIMSAFHVSPFHTPACHHVTMSTCHMEPIQMSTCHHATWHQFKCQHDALLSGQDRQSKHSRAQQRVHDEEVRCPANGETRQMETIQRSINIKKQEHAFVESRKDAWLRNSGRHSAEHESAALLVHDSSRKCRRQVFTPTPVAVA